MTRWAAGAVLLGAAFADGGLAAQAAADSFQPLMDRSMERMNQAMMAPASGDPDRDFAAMMVPHHQGAVEMAEIELRYGKVERLRRLAQGIIVEQRQEIAVMQGVLDTLPAPPAAGLAHTHPMRN